MNDIIDRPINVGDFVFHYSNLYQITSVGVKKARGMIFPKSPLSRAKVIHRDECCVIPKDEMLLYLLKKEEK